MCVCPQQSEPSQRVDLVIKKPERPYGPIWPNMEWLESFVVILGLATNKNENEGL